MTSSTSLVDDIWPGKSLGARQFVVSQAMENRYGVLLGLRDRKYGGEAPVPPIVLTEAGNGFEGDHFSNRFGELWVRQEWQFNRLLVSGERLNVQARVADVYQRRDRTIVATEHLVVRPNGDRVARGVHHNSFLLDQTGGELKLPDQTQRPQARRHPEPIGEPLDSTSHEITLEMCRDFYMNESNYHTDRSIASDLGFRDVVIGAGMIMPYLSEIMTQRFALGWLEGGNLDLKFVSVLHPDEPFTCAGVITGRSEEGGQKYAEVALWAQKIEGPKICVGTARARE